MNRKRPAPSPKTSAAADRRRKPRPRPTPRWLTGRPDLDDVARRRCLMLLSVLSGEKPVSEVIAELELSRGTYYKLETKALAAMLRALAPGADGADSPEAATTTQRIAELEAKVARLEQEKRRGERLLYLARKLVPPGPVTTGAGRPPGSRSTSAGRAPSPSSPTTARTSAPAPSASIPKPGGVTTP